MTSDASYSCSISGSTVKVVENCPDSEEKWMEASARKNCLAYASQCDEPVKLVYHCVINTYVNQTVEVCAYAQNIALGQCAEYNLGGNLIQPNFRTNCTNFPVACPKSYPSTNAFKYPGCYDLTKNNNKATDRPEHFATTSPDVTLEVDVACSFYGKSNMYMSMLTVLLWWLL